MKKLIFCYISLILAVTARAQVHDGIPMDSTILKFSDATIPGFTPDTAAIPLWQTGRSHKPFFVDTSGFDSSAVVAMMTDTIQSYRTNTNNWFTLKVNGINVIIDFWHKYQTAKNKDGGIVEISVDDSTWYNAKGGCNADNSFMPGITTTNFYSDTDTVFTGDAAFTGSHDSMMYSRIQLFAGPRLKSTTDTGCGLTEYVSTWFVRFRFVSDSVTDTLAGWIIDSMKVEHDFYEGAVKNVNKQNALHVYPSPSCDGMFHFPAIENEQQSVIEIYNDLGERILRIPYTHSLELSGYSKGLYYYKITDGTSYYSGPADI